MQVDIEWHEDLYFTARDDKDREVHIDGPPDLGGTHRGTRPMELMLMGMGGCAATDVVHILRKGRVSVQRCQVSVRATRADTDPQIFTHIHLMFRVAGERLTINKLARAVELSADKYCSASILMQRAGVEVSHDFELIAS